MATMTIARPATVNTGSSYAHNVGRAARALLAALFAVSPKAEKKASTSNDDISLYRLYRMAGSRDSVMPNLVQELDAIAKRAE